MGPLTPLETRAEIATKVERVQAFLKQRELAGILLTQVNDFNWITAGAGDNQIVLTSEIGAASILLMADGRKYVIGEAGEITRHAREDLRNWVLIRRNTSGMKIKACQTGKLRSFSG